MFLDMGKLQQEDLDTNIIAPSPKHNEVYNIS